LIGRASGRWFSAVTAAALTAAALTLSACAPAGPTPDSLVHRSAKLMAKSSFQLSGSAKAGVTTISFSVQALPTGDFSGSVDTAVPHSPTLVCDVIAIGPTVWIRSPMALAQLGITSLPGHLSPATAWVLQSTTIAAHYKASLAPFTGAGLASTLYRFLTGRPVLRTVSLSGRKVWLVQLGSGRSSLRLYLQRGSDQVLQLTITGKQAISLRYSRLGAVGSVAAPPSDLVYDPPRNAPGA
jgi:hypothetical protein